MYRLLRFLLFKLDPETAHRMTLKSLKMLERLGLLRLMIKPINNPTNLMGLRFKNPIGLAAGLDKNGEYIDALAALGFGFIEIGTITPKPQPGNEKPRLFRLIKSRAIINRMGFNSKGCDYVASQLKKIRYQGVLGINIGKNKATPNHLAHDDYLQCMEKLKAYASYFTINISSPNTEGLRDLQNTESLDELLHHLKTKQLEIQTTHQKYIPLVVKIAPDLNEAEIESMAAIFLKHQIDGVIATNTTLARDGVTHETQAKQTGGLSGAPLTSQSTHVIAKLANRLGDTIPIIGCGGIHNIETANEKLENGAKLLQVYTGFIYEGPNLINQLSMMNKTTQKVI